MNSLNFKARLISVLIFLLCLGVWSLATMERKVGPGQNPAGMTAEQVEYLKMMGKDPGST